MEPNSLARPVRSHHTISRPALRRFALHAAALTLCATLVACAGPNYGPVPAGHYRVQNGDTLYSIARANNASVGDMVRWNNLSDADKIDAGQVLRVVPPPGSTVAPPPPPPPANASAARPRPPAKPAPRPSTPSAPAPTCAGGGNIATTWPAAGPLLAGYNGSSNKGIDIGGKRGDPVWAAADGKVVYNGNGLRGYGNLVMVQHAGGYLSAYAHNSRNLVKEGATVRKGQQIAEMGDSDSRDVKLHFELRRQGAPCNPMSFLPKR